MTDELRANYFVPGRGRTWEQVIRGSVVKRKEQGVNRQLIRSRQGQPPCYVPVTSLLGPCRVPVRSEHIPTYYRLCPLLDLNDYL